MTSPGTQRPFFNRKTQFEGPIQQKKKKTSLITLKYGTQSIYLFVPLQTNYEPRAQNVVEETKSCTLKTK